MREWMGGIGSEMGMVAVVGGTWIDVRVREMGWTGQVWGTVVEGAMDTEQCSTVRSRDHTRRL